MNDDDLTWLFPESYNDDDVAEMNGVDSIEEDEEYEDYGHKQENVSRYY